MVSDTRVQQFIEAVELDCGEKLTFDDAAKILKGITGYLLILEKIYVRTLNKNNNIQKYDKKS